MGSRRVRGGILSLVAVAAGVLVLVVAACSAVESGEEKDFVEARARMVEADIAGRGVRDPDVLRAMGSVRRQLFVGESVRRQAYADHPLPIGEGQTISQPYVVAWMTEALRLRPTDRVLEVGTGSGYQAAVLAEIVKEVYSVEIRPALAEQAQRNLATAGYKSVWVRTGDGYFGWQEHAPYDAVIVTAAASHIAPPLMDQLRVGGRLIIPLGRTTFYQYLTLVERTPTGIEVDQLGGVAFVPMVGEVRKRSESSEAPR